jgi:endo-1,3-1,4-beta-glycanase ExoK
MTTSAVPARQNGDLPGQEADASTGNSGIFHKLCKKSAISLVLLGISQASLAAEEGVSFVDEFDTFNRTRWFASDGWSNGKWQNCTWSKRQIRLSEGVLTLSFSNQKYKEREYSCAEIQSFAVYGYGTYEARFKTGAGSGLNGAFFTYIGPHFKKPHDEIDFEVLLRDTSKVTVNTFVSSKGGHGASIDVPGRTDAAFNDYAFVWEEHRLRWYVNGRLAHEASSDNGALPSNMQKIYVSIWGSDTFVEWLGPFERPDTPVTLELDRVAFTRLGDACQFPESVACQLN